MIKKLSRNFWKLLNILKTFKKFYKIIIQVFLKYIEKILEQKLKN